MKFPLRTTLALLALVSLATACTDAASSPVAPTPALRITALSGSGGGGGTSGGGGGGGGGGGTVKNGRIDRVSAAASCSAGSSMTVTLQRGFDDRIEAVITATAAAEPTGPAIPPSTFAQTSLGGYETFRIADDAQAITAMSFGSTMGLSTPSYQITNLGRGVPPGTYTFRFVATNYQENGQTNYLYLQTLPPHEICTATLVTTAR